MSLVLIVTAQIHAHFQQVGGTKTLLIKFLNLQKIRKLSDFIEIFRIYSLMN